MQLRHGALTAHLSVGDGPEEWSFAAATGADLGAAVLFLVHLVLESRAALVIRNPLQCASCDSIILTRTQVGHGDRQDHEFPCPKCGIRISFTLDLDQKNVKSSFREPVNAKWVKHEKGAIKTLTFSDEIPVPLDLKGFSPFLETFWNFETFSDYRRDEGLRQSWVRSVFPYCERCMVHFEKGNWPLFDKESPPPDKEPATPASRLMLLYNCLQAGFSKFTLTSRAKRDRVTQRLILARTMSATLFTELAEYYRSRGRILKLWREIGNVRHSFVENYKALQPLLQFPYWRAEKRVHTSFSLSEKRFDSARQLYIDTFETLCRLVILALGVEAIIHHASLELPIKSGTISLEELEKLPNSNKRAFLKKYPIEDLFLTVIDTDLRNGIGHHSAHYEPDTDSVVLYDSKDSGTVKDEIAYTEFCNRILELFAAFELGTIYHHSVHITLEGRF